MDGTGDGESQEKRGIRTYGTAEKGGGERLGEGNKGEEKEREKEKEDKRSRKTQRNVRRGRQRHYGEAIEKDNKANKDRGTQKGGAGT
eukprot:737940-Pleurochrysis_carterae.AAC.1